MIKELPVKRKTAILTNKKEFQYGNNRNKRRTNIV